MTGHSRGDAWSVPCFLARNSFTCCQAWAQAPRELSTEPAQQQSEQRVSNLKEVLCGAVPPVEQLACRLSQSQFLTLNAGRNHNLVQGEGDIGDRYVPRS